MMPICYRAPEREAGTCQIVAMMRQCSPEEARRQIMIGDTQECLDTVNRFVKVGVTHFIFMLMPPYFPDELQAFAETVMPAARKV